MLKVLVVDDSAFDRKLASGLLERHLQADVRSAEDGAAALAALGEDLPDIVITDLQMPEVNGLELVEKIRQLYPTLPVILMTAHGSEEISIQALRRGAASYVPKRNLAEDLATTVQNVLAISKLDHEQLIMLDYLTHNESHFLLDNDPALIAPFISYVQRGLTRMKICDESAKIHVAVALQEALMNAIEHGNLEVDSALREEAGAAYEKLVRTRRLEEPFANRRVHISVRESHSEAVYTIRDEGRGFDPSTLPDPTDPTNLERISGRGLLLIRTFMDEVSHGAGGREIKMVKRRQSNGKHA
jgi:CheY-like chemotaxis protein/anti-sigma regulatory factor (Ser/Thr protein kinase)